MKDKKKHLGSIIFLIILIALTFYFLFRNKELYNLLMIIEQAKPVYLCAGLLAMLLFLASEAFGIWLIMNSFSCHFSFLKCLKYAFIGFFYCSITPTASGGPPMQIYYMKKDGAEISVSSIAILIITVSYQIGILLIGFFMFVVRRSMITETIGLLKFFVLYGVLVNLFLIIAFVSISFHKKLLQRLLNGAIRLLAKLKVIRKQEESVKQAEREEQNRKEAEEQARQEKEMIESTENILLNGGTIDSGDLIVKLADKYNITIPIRTRGWILNTLAECTITEDGGISYRYWKSKNGVGSQKVYDIIFSIRSILKQTA
jgi:uncharacterized protein (TIRG00374 family)